MIHSSPMRACQSLLSISCLLLASMCGCDALSPPRRDPSKVRPPLPPQDASLAGETESPTAADTESASNGPGKPVKTSIVRDNQQNAGQTTRETSLPDNSASGGNADDADTSRVAEAARVRLSAGVALPQTLPTGTAMGFSVDYEFETGGPQPSYTYLWVIRAAHADDVWQSEIPLEARGTLRTFVLQWRPEQGPFEAVLVEVNPSGRRPISAPIPLKASN